MRQHSYDLKAFDAAVGRIYGAAATPDLWPSALHAIAECLDDVGALLIYQRDNGSLGTIASPGLEAAQRDYETGGWWRSDVRFARAEERGYLAGTDAVTERHVMTADEIEGHPFYTDFLAPRGLKWFAGTAISPDPNVHVAIAVQRAASKPPYSDEELDCVARFGRHVETSLRLGIRLIDVQAANMALGESLSRLGIGAYLVDEIGRVLFSNPAAERLAKYGLAVVQGRLTATLVADTTALRNAIGNAADVTRRVSEDDPKAILLRGIAGDPIMAAYVLPIGAQPGGSVDTLLAGVKAIVVVTTSDPRHPPDPTIVRDLLGLTYREAKVAALVGSGLAPQEAAERLHIPEKNVRWALKTVYQKSGVSRQSELVALLARLVLG